MNHKIFNPLAISLATSVFLSSVVNKAGAAVVAQDSLNEPKALLFEVDLSQSADYAGLQTQGQLQPSQAEPQASLQTGQPIHSNSVKQVEQTDQVLVGSFFSLILLYLLVGLQQKKHRTAILLQQIETLERIWNREPHR